MGTKLNPNTLTYQTLHIVIHRLDPFEQRYTLWLHVALLGGGTNES